MGRRLKPGKARHLSFVRRLGPGLITGAADDDPSGIATYSQVGAQFGYGLAWTMLFSLPFMVVIQEISGRIGAVTGRGIAENLRRHYPLSLVRSVIVLLLVANVINLGADLGAMGASMALLLGGNSRIYTVSLGVVCILAEVFLSYAFYAGFLKWLTLSLFSYVAVVFMVHVPWHEALRATFVPHLSFGPGEGMALVAVLGTTISPYLFFWQAALEVEDQRKGGVRPLCLTPGSSGPQFKRIRTDTWVGMGVSNIVAICIIYATAATLHTAGMVDIQTSSQAAEALRPIAGDFTFFVFAAGIVGTGLLACLCSPARRPTRWQRLSVGRSVGPAVCSKRSRSTRRSRSPRWPASASTSRRSTRSGRSIGALSSTACSLRLSWSPSC